MRRTMHAAAILLACVSQVQAQSPSDPKTDQGIRSVSVFPENATDSDEMNHELAVSSVNNRSDEPNLNRGDLGRPYSQLASFMQCNDWRPNLWNNYASERAAIVARVSQHVDMKCKCFECKNNLYHSASSPGCSEGATINLRNRYKAPMSSLYAPATVSSGSACEKSCASQCSYGSPSNVGSVSLRAHRNEDPKQISPVSAVRTAPPGMANPPHDRVATPTIINIPRSAVNSSNRATLFDAR